MRLHPLSAVTRGFQRGLFAATMVFFALGILPVVVPTAVPGLGLVPVAFLLGAGYQVAAYYRFDYELTPDTLDIASGVFGRQEREVPYRRVQNVDITERLFHRLLGVAILSVETAGGSETEAQLDFVSAEEARRLQREIRSRRAAARGETAPESAPAATGTTREATVAGSDAPTGIFSLGSGELLVLSVASFKWTSVIFLIASAPFVQEAVVGTLLELAGRATETGGLTSTPDLVFVAGFLGILLAVLTSWVVSAVVTFSGYYDFTLGRQGEDLVYERGLAQRYSGSIPTDKIQTLSITENVLLRWLGYAGLTVETAGYSPGQGSAGPQSAIPLAARGRTLELARELEGFGEIDLTRPPKRARRRYAVRYLLVVVALTAVFAGIRVVLEGFTLWFTPLGLLPLVPLAAHYKWTHRGYQAGDQYFLVRSGFWTRTTRVVPYYRLQTVVRERSLFQRRLGLAHLTADTATSSRLGKRDATAFDIDEAEAQRLYQHNRDRLQASLGLGS